MLTLAISYLTLSNLPNNVGSHATLFFTASDLTFTTRYIHSWASFLLWPSLFILSGPISLLFPNSILDGHLPTWGTIAWWATVHGVAKSQTGPSDRTTTATAVNEDNLHLYLVFWVFCFVVFKSLCSVLTLCFLCNFPLTFDIQHVFIFPVSLCILFLVNGSLRSFAHC